MHAICTHCWYSICSLCSVLCCNSHVWTSFSAAYCILNNSIYRSYRFQKRKRSYFLHKRAELPQLKALVEHQATAQRIVVKISKSFLIQRVHSNCSHFFGAEHISAFIFRNKWLILQRGLPLLNVIIMVTFLTHSRIACVFCANEFFQRSVSHTWILSLLSVRWSSWCISKSFTDE